MAHSTNNKFVYDCATCSKPVYNNSGAHAWMHTDRKSKCVILEVVAVELTKVHSVVTVDKLGLAA